VLRRIVEYAVCGADLVDEMRQRGELAEHGETLLVGPDRRTSAIGKLTLADLKLDPDAPGLSANRVSEWRSLRDHDALGGTTPLRRVATVVRSGETGPSPTAS